MAVSNLELDDYDPSRACAERKRFILIDREHGNVLGDTGFDWNGQPVPPISGLSPVRAAAMLQVAAQPISYPYRYRTVRRSHPNAVFDAYRAPPGFPRAAEGSPPDAVTRECEYVASLARVYPRCRVCRRPMAPSEHGIDSPGSTATPSTGTTSAAARAATPTASCPRASRPRVLRRTRSSHVIVPRGTCSPTCTAAIACPLARYLRAGRLRSDARQPTKRASKFCKSHCGPVRRIQSAKCCRLRNL